MRRPTMILGVPVAVGLILGALGERCLGGYPETNV
jgi:hypothetical protein